MKIPKGGLHNINQSSQANINDSWNVLATDENNAVLIAVDKCGTKKTVGDTTEIKNSIQALEQENIEQDNRLNLVEQENQNQNTLISELRDDVTNLEGNNINGLQTALNSKQDRLQNVTVNIGVGKTDASATEKLDVNGNVKATQIKDQYGTLKSQRVITITGNITLSETHNGAVLNVTNTCKITVPTGLDANFNCVIFAKGAIIVTFVNSGATIYAPSGLLLKQDKMASLICTATNNFNLTGELATS